VPTPSTDLRSSSLSFFLSFFLSSAFSFFHLFASTFPATKDHPMSDLVTIATALANALPAADALAADALAADALEVAQAYANGALGIGKGIAYGAAAAGASVGIAMVVAATLNGITRQPEQAGALRGVMFLGIGFIEALALIGFVLVFIIK